MDEVFQCVSPSICLESGNHAVASIKNSWIFLENKKKNPVISASCPYSIYDHVIKLLSCGLKINNAYYYCRSCKKVIRKTIAHKCRHPTWTLFICKVSTWPRLEESRSSLGRICLCIHIWMLLLWVGSRYSGKELFLTQYFQRLSSEEIGYCLKLQDNSRNFVCRWIKHSS